MENQHELIKGYRDLTEAEIKLMNDVKAIAEAVGNLVEGISSQDNTDKRWVSIARSQLQLGFMALTRSVAQPTSF